jgi:two-component system phosphate regulon response regulator OmpR
MAHHREGEPFDRSIDIRVARLRRKIEIVPTKPQVIKTIRGGGYMFVPSLGPLAQHSYRAMS